MYIMQDIAIIALILAFFGMSLGLIQFFDTLSRKE